MPILFSLCSNEETILNNDGDSLESTNQCKVHFHVLQVTAKFLAYLDTSMY